MGSARGRTLLGVGVAAVAVVSLIVAARREESRGAAGAGSARARSAATVAVRRTSLATSLTLSGEFKPFQEVELHAKVAGYIRTISVDVGDKVRAGQVLAVLEVPELVAQVEGARATLERARSTHEASHSAYTRLKQASEARPGLIAAQELDDALARDKEAEAQVAVSEASQRQLSALSDYSRITAPFAGVVTKRYADTGAMIQAGTSSSTQAMPVVRLAEYDRLRLTLPVPESAVPRIHLGTVVHVRVPTLGRTFEGRVARFADTVDRQTRTMAAEIDVANSDDSLVAGMYAETVLDLVRKDSALTVPVQAVSRSGPDATVLIVDSQNRVQERRVKLGIEGARRVEVLTGLQENDRVVIGSRSQFRVGDLVEPKPIEDSAAEADKEL
jgi:RND family efflux transporter MFP subunit